MPSAAGARRALLAGVILGGLLLAGCGSGSGTADADRTTEAPATDTATAPTTVSPSGVLLAAACAGTLEPSDAGTVDDPELDELSGLAASRRNPGVWWTHNDSGDTARFFALSATGRVLATEVVDGADAVDWEDMAVGPPDTTGTGQTLYLADMGDNAEQRSNIAIYQVAEPMVSPTATSAVTEHVHAQRITLTYPDGPHDAEALMVDPATGDLIIITKDVSGNAGIYRATASPPTSSTTALERVGTLDLSPLTLVTGADISPDGSVVAVRTYGQVLLYPRPAGMPVWAAFTQSSCSGTSPTERQGESVAFTVDGSAYATVSEGTNPVLHVTHP